ncbi:hypothetical protein BV20DRAFT_1056888 [Pilatotrama ljubarskyi]|nr:hypothetical protein BV20DRAFT_1056888 [Pilatotrama ljubarskyi]
MPDARSSPPTVQPVDPAPLPGNASERCNAEAPGWTAPTQALMVDTGDLPVPGPEYLSPFSPGPPWIASGELALYDDLCEGHAGSGVTATGDPPWFEVDLLSIAFQPGSHRSNATRCMEGDFQSAGSYGMQDLGPYVYQSLDIPPFDGASPYPFVCAPGDGHLLSYAADGQPGLLEGHPAALDRSHIPSDEASSAPMDGTGYADYPSPRLGVQEVAVNSPQGYTTPVVPGPDRLHHSSLYDYRWFPFSTSLTDCTNPPLEDVLSQGCQQPDFSSFAQVNDFSQCADGGLFDIFVDMDTNADVLCWTAAAS